MYKLKTLEKYKRKLQKQTEKRANFDTLDEYGFKTMKTSDLIDNYYLIRKDGKGIEYKYRVPKSKAVEYSEKELLINPYILGVWLGDGDSAGVRITSGNLDVKKYGSKILNNVDTRQ